METKYLKFWGTRGSCPVSGVDYLHFGGNTPSLEIRYGEQIAILDAGTGIRPLGLALPKIDKIDLFLSHFHWDHINGFPFFEPIYRKEVNMTIWAPHSEGRSTQDLFEDLLAFEFFPIHLSQIQAKLNFELFKAKQPVQLGNLTIDFHETIHPGHSYCFKIKTPKMTIGYVTDNEIDFEKQKSFIEFYKGVDLFIHEAQYTSEEYKSKKGWGHSSLNKMCELIEKIGPSKCLVTHHDPKHSDSDLREMEEIARSRPLPCPIEWVHDGYSLPIL